MKINEAFKQVEKLFQAIKPIHPDLEYEKMEKDKTPFKKWFREEVPAAGYSKKSGIYIFSNSEEDILYIGKAASDNFGAEIYGKFGTASETDKEDMPRFDNSSMAKWAPDEYKEAFKAGDIYISALSIMPKEFTSLFEVYLQIWCSVNDSLPPVNKRIG